MPLKIVFMGTPEFSVPTLEILIKKKFNILKVYTQPPKKSKRGQKVNASPIEDFCKKNNVNFDNPMNLNTHEVLKNFKLLLPDVVVVVAYGQIISKVFLEAAKFGFINIHASLLPKWRGAAPIQRAIINGDKKVGLTIMKIQEKLDSGPILASKEIDLNQNETHGEIEKKLSLIGADLLIDTLTNIESSISKFTEQIHVDATYAKKIDNNETKINWNLDANKVLAHIHGLSPRPGAWFNYKNERFKILRAKISSQNGKQGLIINENLTVACKTNSIQILELQREGKTKQTAKDFLLGKKINKGYLLS
jgi:methionyl-tRNA formyltransferase